MADLLFDYNIKKTAILFDEDLQLKKVLFDYGVYISDLYIDEINPERIKLYETIASLFLSDHTFISARSIEDLWLLEYQVTRLNQIFNKADVVDEVLFRQLLFSYKYSSIKHFFQDNFTKFLPSPDAAAIQDNEKMKIFQTSFMKEYDRFADIIDNIYNIVDVDKVGNDYLAYLIQILGYEKGDDKLLGNDSFRELAKNIIEVYKMKGTNYSFELFFNFLGFNISLREFWFDKRFSDPGISLNPYTNSANPDTFAYYLTPYDPTEYIPANMNFPYQVMKNQMTDIRSHLWFEKKIQQGIFSEVLLGNNGFTPPEGFDYSFFKTNVISYEVTRIRSQDTDADELSPEDEKIINAYADFLTPIFILKQVSISVSPFEDVAEGLYFVDNSYYDRSKRTIVNMYKQHDEQSIIDDWVDDPLESWKLEGRAPLKFLEFTDVDSSVDNEEPQDVYIWLNYSNDDLKTIKDADDMNSINGTPSEFASGNLLHVQSYTKEQFLSQADYTRSLWDVVLGDEIPMMSVTVGAIDESNYDEAEGLEKIVNYCEVMFNRIQRTEYLDIFNRDYYDWDSFKEIRHIPSFADSIDQKMTLNTFEVTSGDVVREYINNDELLADTPWLFFDSLRFLTISSVGNIYLSMIGKILFSGVPSYKLNYIIERMLGQVNSITGDNNGSLSIPARIYANLISTSGNILPNLNISRVGDGLVITNGWIQNKVNYLPLLSGFANLPQTETLHIPKYNFNSLTTAEKIILSGSGLFFEGGKIFIGPMVGSMQTIGMNTLGNIDINFLSNVFINLRNDTTETILNFNFNSIVETLPIELTGTSLAQAFIYSTYVGEGMINTAPFDENFQPYPTEVSVVAYNTVIVGSAVTFGEISANVTVYKKVDNNGIVFVNGEAIRVNDYLEQGNGLTNTSGTITGKVGFNEIVSGLVNTSGGSDRENDYLNPSNIIINTSGGSDRENDYLNPSDIILNTSGDSGRENDYLSLTDGVTLTFGQISANVIYVESGTGYIPVGGTSEQYNDYIELESNGVSLINGSILGSIILDRESVIPVTLEGNTIPFGDYIESESNGIITTDGNSVENNDYVDTGFGMTTTDGSTIGSLELIVNTSGSAITDGLSDVYDDYIELESNGIVSTSGIADIEIT